MAPSSPEKEMSLFDHLEELRGRIITSLMAFSVCVVIGYFLAPWPLDWLSEPIERAHADLVLRQQKQTLIIDVATDGTMRLRDQTALDRIDTHTAFEFHRPGTDKAPVRWAPGVTPSLFYMHPMDPFMIRVKAAMIIGLILSLPVILYQLWMFINPGLHAHEKRFALPVIVTGTVLFPVGAAFAFFMMEVTLDFFASFVMGGAGMMNDASTYLGFTLAMMLAFGLVFELPLGLVIATRMGLVSVDWLAGRRRIIFVVILVVAAVATPSGDPFTMLAMGLPLYLLFEVAMIVSRVLEREDREREAKLTAGPDA
ncbi:twin-arginine translocase subunit TatC [bacterium]|nr:twin-arginine translocase subunit TatC [bacterium]